MTGVVSVVRVVAAKALVLVDGVSSGSALLFSVSVADCFFEVEVVDRIEVINWVGVRVGIEIVLEPVLTGRPTKVELTSETTPVGIVNDEVKEEINEGSTGRDPFVWTGSGVSVAKVGIFDNMLEKIGRILVGAVLLIGRSVGSMERILVNVGKIDCKVEGIADTIGTLPTSISKKNQKKLSPRITRTSYDARNISDCWEDAPQHRCWKNAFQRIGNGRVEAGDDARNHSCRSNGAENRGDASNDGGRHGRNHSGW